ncbi:hypothetical protein Q9K01_02105 [Qipengyuania sp. DY56-A-20]|jgi:hypothetical protein|uniref:Uncharacterized protein n=1 Tax=Qipengyuania benthica TaxID=3067651 RepID=A0ABT9H6D2_9SPHN|nr:hypothetical protein [Qipengyuania sp. DY56-A-20]MDP4538420.1 hypothetical protein [Qipengyuania sp. DY56-A-20]
MTHSTYRSSSPDRWTMPRGASDTSLRRQIHGRIQPLDPPSFLERLFGMR